MAGTKEGALKAAETNKKKYGNDYYKRLGAKGGSRKTPTSGFGSPKRGPDGLTGPERARVVGSLGGLISSQKRGAK